MSSLVEVFVSSLVEVFLLSLSEVFVLSLSEVFVLSLSEVFVSVFNLTLQLAVVSFDRTKCVRVVAPVTS